MTQMSTSALRREYGPACKEHAKAGAQEAWDRVSAIMQRHGYELHGDETGSRNCRPITGGTDYSLHAFFLAITILLWNLGKRIAGAVACDFNWRENPYGSRLVTNMPRAMVDGICAIRTRSGHQVFRWGGYYTGNKDPMHFEIACSAADLATGIDPASVHTGSNPQPQPTPTSQPPQEDDMEVIKVAAPGHHDDGKIIQRIGNRWRVIDQTTADRLTGAKPTPVPYRVLDDIAWPSTKGLLDPSPMP